MGQWKFDSTFVYSGIRPVIAGIDFHWTTRSNKPRAWKLTDFLLFLCSMQILSVAVYNHYKRIYFESLRKGNMKPSNSEGLVLFFGICLCYLFFCIFELEYVKELVGASGILSMHAHRV